MRISQRNHAPSAAHADHDVYAFDLIPNTARPFAFSQSVGGGHAESGGTVCLSLAELDAWPGEWRAHLERAGCRWVIAVIATSLPQGDQSRAVQDIIARLTEAA